MVFEVALTALANIGIFSGIFLRISLENGASWFERWIFLRVSGIYLRVLWLSISQASRDIPKNIPRNIPRLARTLNALSSIWIFLGISMFPRKGRKTVLAGLREGYPWDFQEHLVDILLSGKLAPFSFYFFRGYIPKNILTLASILNGFSDRGRGGYSFWVGNTITK